MAPMQSQPYPLSIAVAVRRGGAAAARHRWTRGLLQALAYPQSPDDYLQALSPDWALDKVIAKVREVRRETRDTTSLHVEPPPNWRPHRAGQHVLLTVTLRGVQHTRCFSLSAAHRPGAPLRLTIKAHDGGRVSCWARDGAAVGDRVELSQPQGDFVLPEPLPDRLLFLSGGSGMTPLLAMAQALVHAGYAGSLRWIHSERTEVALLGEMQSACASLGTELDLHRTGGRHALSKLSRSDIAARVPDYAERHAFACGPRGLMDAALALYVGAGRRSLLHHEDFQPRRAGVLPMRPRGDEVPQLVLARSRRTIRAQPGASLLESAERAGLHPPHGCRRGICHTCRCKKHHGTVRNEVTGVESDARDEEIRLCIHSPVTDVTLDL